MNLAYPTQQLQDWITQQWAILSGRKIDPTTASWLMGPFGNLNGIGKDFIYQLAAKESLTVDTGTTARGLIPSIHMLNLPEQALASLSAQVIDFYENTAAYDLDFSVQWNPVFKVFGVLLNKLFSNRINQLNIPTRAIKNGELLESEIIRLIDQSGQVKYTFWLRSVRSSGRVIYSGAYGVGTLPSGQACIKAVFPLPNGNATVLMTPAIGANGALVLDASGSKFGDAGFYFLLKDSKGNYWSKFIRSFRDRLIISQANDHLTAVQTLTLWHTRVLTFHYKITRRNH